MKKILYTISFCIILNVQPLFSQNDTLNINVGTTYNSRENFSAQKNPRSPQKEAISIKLGHFKDNLSSQLALNFYKNNEINFDNSFFKYNKGIATFTIGKINRVWSFSNKNSLILSSNARPFETFSAKLENKFNTNWLPKSANWSFETIVGSTKASYSGKNSNLLGFRLAINPLKKLRFELLQTSQWDKNTSSLQSLGPILFGNSNEGTYS